MGMYTELRFDVRLSEDGVRVVQALNEANRRRDPPSESPWIDVMPMLVDITKKLGADPTQPIGYLNQKRRNFIPYGHHEEHRNELDGNVWHVTCELKNYDATIEHFLSVILPLLIAEPVTAFSHYEESVNPTPRPVEPFRPVLREVSDVG